MCVDLCLKSQNRVSETNSPLRPLPSFEERGIRRKLTLSPGHKTWMEGSASTTLPGFSFLLSLLSFPPLVSSAPLSHPAAQASLSRGPGCEVEGEGGVAGRVAGSRPVPPLATTPCRKGLSPEQRQKGSELGGRRGALAGGSQSPLQGGGGGGRAAGKGRRGLGCGARWLGASGLGASALGPVTLVSLFPGTGGAAMLLSGGRPPAQEWFMVQSKSKPRVHRQRLQVQRIFRVKVNAFQSRPDTPYFWLQLEGPRENTGKAKVISFSSLPT